MLLYRAVDTTRLPNHVRSVFFWLVTCTSPWRWHCDESHIFYRDIIISRALFLSSSPCDPDDASHATRHAGERVHLWPMKDCSFFSNHVNAVPPLWSFSSAPVPFIRLTSPLPESLVMFFSIFSFLLAIFFTSLLTYYTSLPVCRF